MEGLSNESSLVDCAISLMDFMTNTCGHHFMNHIMKSVCEKFFGDGGDSTEIFIQLFLKCWSIQDKYEMSE